MTMPLPWVEKIFRKLTLVYGRDFLSRWEGQEINGVIDDWALELAGFANWPEAIGWALNNLPADRPPTVLQFRDICRRAPGKAMLALPEPPADPERLKAELAKLASVPVVQRQDPKAWAQRIMARHAHGDRLSTISVRFAREAIGIPQPGATAEV